MSAASPKTWSVCLLDDHVVIRKGLKQLIEQTGRYKVITEFDNGQDLMEALPFETEPDIIIADVEMPVMNGKEMMRSMKEQNYSYPTLILTLDTGEKTIIELFRLGVNGYLAKTCTPDILYKALDDIMTTGYYHNEFTIMALKADEGQQKLSERDKVLSQLTDREKVFMQLVCHPEEYTYEQMADLLNVHRRTIDNYRQAMFDKFNIKSKTGLVLFAIKYGLIDLAENKN